jgi:arylsulfatase A-like enzyme
LSISRIPCDHPAPPRAFTENRWELLAEEIPVMPEILQKPGYTTALFADTHPFFKPRANFHRGLDEWHWIRGQEGDAVCSFSNKKPDTSGYYLPKDGFGDKMVLNYLKRMKRRRSQIDWCTPKLFSAASKWLETNYKNPFFLCIDRFTPHEPFDPPEHYLNMYDSEYDGMIYLILEYTSEADYMTEREIKHTRARYAGLVTLMDKWLGYFLQSAEGLGLMENTVFVVLSDHGHSLGENKCTGKNALGMLQELMHLVLFVRISVRAYGLPKLPTWSALWESRIRRMRFIVVFALLHYSWSMRLNSLTLSLANSGPPTKKRNNKK